MKIAFNFLDNIWLRYKIVKVVENIGLSRDPISGRDKSH
jgi:hypothetical protein